MARAYPEWTAGEGDTSGKHGSSSEWPFIVEVDKEGDSPWPPLLAVAGMGTSHPDPDLKNVLYVSDYRKGPRLNETYTRIFVIYSPPSDTTIGLWRRSGRFANETRKLERSLGNFADDGTVLDAPLFVGPGKYEVPKTGTAWDGKYQTEDLDKVNRIKAVDPSGGGIEINDGLLSLSYEITVQQLTVTQIQTLMWYRWHTNNASWPPTSGRDVGYEKWSLIFSNFAFEDSVINLVGPGPVWYSTVQLELLYKPIHTFLNPFGWRGTRQYEYFTDDDGYRHNVFDVSQAGSPIAKKDYVTYESAAFTSLFETLSAGPIR